MSLIWLLNWWNLIFILPFGLALLYLGVYTVSGLTFGEGEGDLHGGFGDADADMDGGAALHADADLQHDLHMGSDAGADADTDGDGHDAGDADGQGDAGQPIHLAVLSWLGVGRVPLSIVLMVLLLFWGSIGFITNAMLRPTFGDSWHAVSASLPIALIGTLLLTRGVVLAMARWLPLNESTAQRRHALLGAVGEAIYDIDATFGMVAVRERSGDLYQLPCRVEDQAPPIRKGSRVKLVAYGGPQSVYYVVAYEETSESTTSAGTKAGTQVVAPVGDGESGGSAGVSDRK